MKLNLAVVVFVSLFLFSCENKHQDKTSDVVSEKLTTKQIINKSYEFYGIETLEQKDISFKFRVHEYSYIRNGEDIIRSRRTVDTNNIEIKDIWKKDKVERFINDSLVVITNEKEKAYRNSINSVFYFAFLPKGLTDRAVNTELLESIGINQKDYFKIRVTFDEEGGGEDHNDIFLYWFDKEDFSMDYLAYQYFTEGGGIRFREAINSREINGITFQDYVNYKPSSDTIKLVDTDQAFENDKLKEVSRIELENLEVD